MHIYQTTLPNPLRVKYTLTVFTVLCDGALTTSWNILSLHTTPSHISSSVSQTRHACSCIRAFTDKLFLFPQFFARLAPYL